MRRKIFAFVSLSLLCSSFCFAQRSLKDMNRGTFPRQNRNTSEEELREKARPVNIINAPSVRQTTVNGRP